MVFPKPWVKYSMKFLRFFSFLYQFIDSKKKTRGQLIQSTNIKYKLWKSQNYLYDHYHLISRTKTYKVNQKINKYTSGKLEKRNTPKIGDSSNNDRAGAQKCSIKKVF